MWIIRWKIKYKTPILLQTSSTPITLLAVTYFPHIYSNIIKYTFNISSGFGNGQIDFNEECDDNNLNNNDGCSSICKLEKNFNCC